MTKKSNLVLLFAALALLGAFAVGCGSGPAASDVQRPASTAGSDVATAKAAIGPDGKVVAYRNAEGRLVCPVMGNVIKSEESATGYQDYNGVRYYFCCGLCPSKFKADPAKYAKK